MLGLSVSTGPSALAAVISTLFGNSGLVSCTADSTADDDVENAN